MRLGLALLAVAGCARLGEAHCEEPDRSCDRRPEDPGAVTVRRLRERAPPYPGGRPVAIRAVSITAVDRYDETMSGRVGTVWAQEVTPVGTSADRFAPCPLLPDGSGRVCAISMFSPAFAPSGYRPAEGELVDVVGGSYEEFTCAPCGSTFRDGNFLPQIADATLRRAGVAPSQRPVPVTLADIAAHHRELLGVLVTVEDVTALTAPDPRFGEMTVVNAGDDSVSLAPQLTPIPGARAGARWSRVTGIVTYFYNPKLLPRAPGDLVPAP